MAPIGGGLMSLESSRAEIANALSTVAGITGYQKRPNPPVEGDAWPLWSGSDRADGSAFLPTWSVRILVPQDEAAATDWWDDHRDAVLDALRPVLYVQRVAPAAIAASGSDLLIIEISGITEE